MCYTDSCILRAIGRGNTMFTGFTDETVDFMWGIRFNNERTWFEAHKEIGRAHV